MNIWVYALELLISTSCVWLGLYIYTRNRDLSLSRAMALALVIFSIYFLGNALMATSNSSQENNWAKISTWWASPVAAALWFNVVTYLIENIPAKKFVHFMKVFRWAILGTGIILGYLGVATEWLYLFSDTHLANRQEGFIYGKYLIPPAQQPFDIFDRYLIFTVFLAMVCMLVMLFYSKSDSKHDKSTKRIYTALSISVFFAALLNILTYAFRIYAATFYTDLLFFAVPFTLAWLVSQETAISAKENQSQDLLHSMIGFALLLFFIFIIPIVIAKITEVFLLLPINYIQISITTWISVFLYMLFDDLSLAITSLIARKDIEYHKKIILMREKGHRLTTIDDLPSATTIIHTYVNKELIRKIFTQETNIADETIRTPLIKLACINKKLVDIGATQGKISLLEYHLAIKQVIEDALDLLENKIVHIPGDEREIYLSILKSKIQKKLKTRKAAIQVNENETQYHRYYSKAIHYLVMSLIYLETETDQMLKNNS
jgi:hypothetical protein